MKTVKVRKVILGEGIPKVCIPLIAKKEAELLVAAKVAYQSECDIVEWRLDFYQEVQNFRNVLKVLKKIREILKDKPLLVTFRSKKEGGEQELSSSSYFELYREILSSGYIDLIDIELFMPTLKVRETIKLAQQLNIKVILCNHDFNGTPSQTEIVSRLIKMQEIGADICKIAVMPNSVQDVLTLLAATNEMVTKYADRPIVTMSMGKKGVISRISGEFFGSAMTFGTIEAASAPGQLPVKDLHNALALLHRFN